MPRRLRHRVQRIFGLSLTSSELLPVDEKILRRVRKATNLGLLVAAGLGATAIAGWVVDSDVLRSIQPGRTAMNPLTALTFGVCSLALWLRMDQTPPRRLQTAHWLALFAVLVGAVTLVGYVAGRNLGLDQIFFRSRLDGNRIAPNTGLCFLLTGLAILILDRGRRRQVRPPETLAILVLLLAVNAILGYLYDAGQLYGWAQYIPMALPTALAFLGLSMTILFARPQLGIMSLIVSPTLGGKLARRLLPATVLGIAGIGYVRLLGQRAGLYDVGFGVASFVVVVILMLVTLILLTSRSLTRVELVQRETEAAHARLAAIVENADDAIIGKTLDGTITSWNDGAERLYQYTAEEAIGRSMRMLIPPGHPDDETGVLAKVSAGQVVKHFATRRRRKDGGVVDISLTVSPIRDKTGRVIAASGIARDITAEKRVEAELKRAREAAEEAARAKSAFLANMSHEIRTPLNAIIGMSGLLEDTRLNEEQREFAQTIRISGEHLLSIINDILDFSKIESGRLELENHVFNIIDCIEEAIELVLAPARQKNLELAYAIEPSVPQWLLGDVGRVRQVLVNLLTNAVKFTEQGSVSIIMAARPLDGGWCELDCQVRDTGIGISPETQKSLFQSFTQGDPSMSRRYGGTGLGLAISKQLVELMGGHIGLQSQEGRGTTFTFTLRLEVAPTPAEPERQTRELQGIRILVVDDNVANRRLLTVLAERWGMNPRVSANPQEALQWLQSNDPIDVAVLDYHMPDMDGVTLAQRVRELPHRKELPMILLSSGSDRPNFSELERARFVRMLQKPARQSQLHDAIMLAVNPGHAAVGARRSEGRAPSPLKLRVLLAEDNPTNQLVAAKMLRKLGVDPVIVNNGQEALKAVQEERFHIVFMDVQMPLMDGLEATRRICARMPRAQRPLIVAMTAEAMHGDRERCLEAGMDDYVTKPVKLTELQRVLASVKPD